MNFCSQILQFVQQSPLGKRERRPVGERVFAAIQRAQTIRFEIDLQPESCVYSLCLSVSSKTITRTGLRGIKDLTGLKTRH